MATRTQLGALVQDAETFTYSTTILQEDGVTPVDLTDANTDAFVTLYRADTNAAINSRNAQQVITAGVASNNHTGTALGVLTFKSVAADSTLGESANVSVVLRYRIQYNDGAAVARDGTHEVQFTVEPLVTVT
jgi:membrane-bound lytic murein transglycosylase